MPGEVGRVRGAGIQHIPNTDRVDLLGLEADAGHGGVRGEHLEVNRAVGLEGTPECAEGSPLGGYNKHSPGQNVSCGHLVLIEEIGLKCDRKLKDRSVQLQLETASSLASLDFYMGTFFAHFLIRLTFVVKLKQASMFQDHTTLLTKFTKVCLCVFMICGRS